ncbi:MAG: hypothetical protein ACLPKB_26110 [Xanthobacteraceae bacterium]
MEFAKQRKMIEVNKGLFLIRYTSAEDEARPPKVEIFLDPTSVEDIELVLHPEHEDAILWQPGSCLVVRATAPGKLALEVTSHRDGASTAATVNIEPLTQGEAGSRLPPAKKPRGGAVALDLDDLRVLGHIAGIGDVTVGLQEWLAGPSSPSRIEGISIDWPGKPDDVDIRYSVKLAKPQAPSGQMMALGSFAGTRGRAMPVVGVILEMSGAEGRHCQFVAEAIFLGSPAMRVTGKRVVLAGPTGRETLVGLRVGIEEKGAQPKGARSQPQPATARSQPGRPSSRVRVFRSRSKQDQTEPS